MKARAGSAYISCNGRSGNAIAEAARSGPNISASTRTNGVASASSGDWLSAASASGSHSHSVSRSALPAIPQPSRYGDRRRASGTRPVRASSRRAAASDGAIRRTDNRSRHDIADHLQHRRPAGAAAAAAADTRRTERAPSRSRNGTLSASCRAARFRRADASQKFERLGVAAEQHVLPVVHELAGDAIAERRRPAAKLRPRLEDEHADVRLAASAAAADSPAKPPPTTTVCGVIVGVGVRTRAYPARRACESTSPAAMTARRGRGMRTTSEKTS